MDEMDLIGLSKFDDSYSLAFLFDGLLWTKKATTSAPMTEFWKHKHRIFKNGNGIVGANFSTFAAIAAFLFNDFRDGEINRFTGVNARLQEKMGVGFLHITVQKLNRSIAIEGLR
jgi:hypothetical protein